MKPGDSLTFLHKEGGQLFVAGPARGLFSVRCSDARGAVVAESPRVSRPRVRKVIARYINGDTPDLITRLLQSRERSLDRDADADEARRRRRRERRSTRLLQNGKRFLERLPGDASSSKRALSRTSRP